MYAVNQGTGALLLISQENCIKWIEQRATLIVKLKVWNKLGEFKTADMVN